MNEKTYIEKLKQDPNFLQNIENVDVFEYSDSIDIYEENNEARHSSHDLKILQDMYESIMTEGVLVPVDYTPKAGNGKVLCDGFGRVGRVLKIIKECEEKISSENSSAEDIELAKQTIEKVRNIPSRKVNYKNPCDKRIETLLQNFHLPSSAATNTDIANVIVKNIVDGDLSSGMDTSDVDFETISEYIRKDRTEGGMGLGRLHGRKISGIAQKVLDRLPYGSTKFKNWGTVSDQDLINFFNRVNPYGICLVLDSKGKYVNGSVAEVEIADSVKEKWAVYFCKQGTYADQNIVHYSLNKKRGDNKDVKVLLVAYNGNNLSVKKDPESDPIATYRTSIGKIVDEWNNHPFIITKIVDELCFLPQFVNVEDFDFLYDKEGNKIEVNKEEEQITQANAA